MERLALLGATQSRASSAWKAPADTPQDTKQRETSRRWDFLLATALSSVEVAHGLAAFIRPTWSGGGGT